MDNNEQITTPLAVIILSFALKMKVFQNSINTIQKILLCHVFDGKAERLIYFFILVWELRRTIGAQDGDHCPITANATPKMQRIFQSKYGKVTIYPQKSDTFLGVYQQNDFQ